jgi:ElaB/YqjD/DUF883 family membrane-anchored ribosome-binding protein
MSPRDREAKNQEKAAEDAGQEAAEAVARRSPESVSPEARTAATDDPEEIRREIEETREELGDTVEALSEKADVEGQISEKVEERKQALRAKQAQLKEKVTGARQQASEATPEDVKQKASQAGTVVSEQARQRPIPTIVGALVVGLLLGRLLRKRG